MNNGKYDEVKDIVIASIREGDKNVVACKKAGINQDTFYKWLKDRAEFSEAVKKARDEFREEISSKLEASLWKKAQGYEVEESKEEYAMKKGERVLVKKTTTKKHIAPDTGALIFALTNVDPDNWKNRQDNRLSVDDSVTGFNINIVRSEETPPIANSEDDIEG